MEVMSYDKSIMIVMHFTIGYMYMKRHVMHYCCSFIFSWVYYDLLVNGKESI